MAGAEHTCVLRVDGAESRAARAAPDELRVSGECADVCEDSDGGVPLLLGNLWRIEGRLSARSGQSF